VNCFPVGKTSDTEGSLDDGELEGVDCPGKHALNADAAPTTTAPPTRARRLTIALVQQLRDGPRDEISLCPAFGHTSRLSVGSATFQKGLPIDYRPPTTFRRLYKASDRGLEQTPLAKRGHQRRHAVREASRRAAFVRVRSSYLSQRNLAGSGRRHEGASKDLPRQGGLGNKAQHDVSLLAPQVV
jgi:hypothetical protein